MLRVSFDHASLYQVRLPRLYEREAILSLAETFIATDQRQATPSPYLPTLQTLLTQAKTLKNGAMGGENKRLTASEAVKRYDEQAQLLTRQIVNLLRGHFIHQPAEVTKWGLTLKQSTGNIITPHGRDKRLAFLNSYIAQEESRPVAERFTLPPLAEVRQVRDNLQNSLTNRFFGQTERETNLMTVNEVLEKLLNLIQASLVHILATQFAFTVSPALQEWGITVVQTRKPYKIESQKIHIEPILLAG